MARRKKRSLLDDLILWMIGGFAILWFLGTYWRELAIVVPALGAIGLLIVIYREWRAGKGEAGEGGSNARALALLTPDPKASALTLLMPDQDAHPAMRYGEPDERGVPAEIDWPETFGEIERAVRRGDYDFARTWLQKYAYTLTRPKVPQRLREEFKKLMAAFAKEDPLYQRILPLILAEVNAQPGLLQTAIYPRLPQYDQETLRYVLYFAEALGQLRREKKGRSYRLYLP